MKSNFLVWVILAGLVLVGGYYYININQPSDLTGKPGAPTTSSVPGASPEASKAQPVVVALNEQNNLGQSGTATLTENAEENLVVTLSLSGGSFTSPQPAHIHLGNCPHPGGIKFDLANVVDGKSETLIDTNWSELVAAGEKLALNVHKSGAEAKIYTACGDLPLTEGTGTMSGASVKLDTQVKY